MFLQVVPDLLPLSLRNYLLGDQRLEVGIGEFMRFGMRGSAEGGGEECAKDK
jgi:hypothetical protein